MKIYEVIFWGSNGDGNAEDTIYLVRAPDFRSAADEAQRVASLANRGDIAASYADAVYEVGVNLGSSGDSHALIILGPCYAYAVNRGWKAWKRKLDQSNEWEENHH